MEAKTELQKGDTIKCISPDEVIKIDRELCKDGFSTDYIYEKDGIKGFWLEIVEVIK